MTDPKHLLDYLLWPILKIVWEPFSRKNAHFWQWRDTDYQPAVYLTIEGKNTFRSRHDSRFQNLVQTNFGWKEAAILRPVNYTGKYQVGFFSTEGHKNHRRLCSVVLEGDSAALIGPYVFSFFALSYPDRKELKLEKIAELNKWELDKKIFLV